MPEELKAQIRADLTTAMKARQTLTVSTLRMALAAITNEEVAGTTSRTLTDGEVVNVLAKEIKKRHEAAEVYAAASRPELAEQETNEAAVLQGYVPAALDDDDLNRLVVETIGEASAGGEPPTMKQMGQLVKAVQAKAAGRADGKRVATAVRAALQ